MPSFTPGPLFVEQETQRPFRLILRAVGGEVLESHLPAVHSSAARTLEEQTEAVCFPPAQREAAIAANTRQLADMQLRAIAPEMFDQLKVLAPLMLGLAGVLEHLLQSLQGADEATRAQLTEALGNTPVDIRVLAACADRLLAQVTA